VCLNRSRRCILALVHPADSEPERVVDQSNIGVDFDPAH